MVWQCEDCLRLWKIEILGLVKSSCRVGHLLGLVICLEVGLGVGSRAGSGEGVIDSENEVVGLFLHRE